MTHPNRPRAAAYAITTAAGLLLAGCSSGSTGADSELGPISQRVTALGEQFDADVMTAQTNAVDELVADCMKAQGFDYTPQRRDPSAQAASLGLPDMNTMEFAEQYGYGITTLDDVTGTTDQSTGQTSTPEYEEALVGRAYRAGEAQMPGGCAGEAMTEVFGDVTSLDTTVAADIAGLRDKADEDSRVVAALDDWSKCMDDHDYSYTTPEAARTSIISRALDSTGALVQGDTLRTLRTEEIDTAVADIGCRDSTGLTQARAKALARVETDYYATHKDQVDSYLDQIEEVIKGK